MVLPDLLKPNLDIVFCGTAVGNRSANQEAYYAGCGNKFYCVLFNVGLTPVQLIPSNYDELLVYNIGLTDLVKSKHGMDNDLQFDDFDVQSFKRKILEAQPKLICFNGKQAAKSFFNIEKIDYGLQFDVLGETKLYVAPSTSPTAHKYWDEKYWQNLKSMI